MPIYEYECQTCRHRFERLQHFSDEPVKVCPDCGAPVQRVIQPVGVIFRGSGFYVTDNRQLPANEAAKELPGGDGGEAKEKDKTTADKKE
ncbi:MAG: FmdB family transcriptional regulator [Chloroflexi bacterium B3_Chlor]|nr:MAG: FmdB family transcriptional regulator [Chloroflexi bacterium B3_Chlor]